LICFHLKKGYIFFKVALFAQLFRITTGALLFVDCEALVLEERSPKCGQRCKPQKKPAFSEEVLRPRCCVHIHWYFLPDSCDPDQKQSPRTGKANFVILCFYFWNSALQD